MIIEKMDEMELSGLFVPFKIMGDICKIHPDKPSSVSTIKCKLMCAIFDLWEQGWQVNTRTAREGASRLTHEFRNE
jgi:hypothetical protein